MSRYRLILTQLLLILALAGAAQMITAASARRAHLADSDCAGCHLSGDRTRAGATTLQASEEVLCGRCHANAMKASHPSGFAARRGLPAEYPVDWKGDVTCSTCHHPHGNVPGLLRGARRGRDFCQSCHDEAFFRRMRDGGASMMISGHFVDGMERALGELDAYSLQCMGCHGVMGEANAVRVDRNAIIRHASGGANHPIGRRYAEAVRFGGYRPEALVTRRLFLPGGKVSCVSCHQVYTKEHGKLVMSNARSALCFECHDK